MALTPSTMLALGTQAPDFRLPDVVTGKTVSLSNFAGKKALLVMFICKHCPYVIHVHEELSRIGHDYTSKGVGVVGISSNDAEAYPDDNPENLKKMVSEWNFHFPVLFDESQEIAKTYSAACTPDIYLFDENQKLVYRGQLDETRPKSGKTPTGKDLRAALDAVLAGTPVNSDQQPSTGCNIKWKPGNQPAYF